MQPGIGAAVGGPFEDVLLVVADADEYCVVVGWHYMEPHGQYAVGAGGGHEGVHHRAGSGECAVVPLQRQLGGTDGAVGRGAYVGVHCEAHGNYAVAACRVHQCVDGSVLFGKCHSVPCVWQEVLDDGVVEVAVGDGNHVDVEHHGTVFAVAGRERHTVGGLEQHILPHYGQMVAAYGAVEHCALGMVIYVE